MTSPVWSWLGSSSSPRGQYKSTLPYLPTSTKNRQAEQFRENLQTGNSEYGSFWGADFTHRPDLYHRHEPDYVIAPSRSREWRGGASWNGDQYDQYLNSVYSSLQAGRKVRGHHGGHGVYHVDCNICNPRLLPRDAYAGYEDDPLMRVHKINMFNLGQALTDVHLPSISPRGLQYGFR